MYVYVCTSQCIESVGKKIREHIQRKLGERLNEGFVVGGMHLKAKAFHRLRWCVSVFVFLSGEREKENPTVGLVIVVVMGGC